MADVKISSLPSVLTVAAANVFPLVASGVTSMISGTNLGAGITPFLTAASTSNQGAVVLATSGSASASTAVQGSDARLATASTTNRGTVLLAPSGGTTAFTVVQGDDARLATASTTNRGTVLFGVDGSTTALTAVQGSDSRLAAATTTNRGTVLLAPSGGTTASTVVQGSDSRLAQATDSNRGTVTIASAATIVTGTDTAQVPNVANLKTSLASDGMWLTKRTKMPDVTGVVESQDAWATTYSWSYAGSCSLSVAATAGALRTTPSSGAYGPLKAISGIEGKTLVLRYRMSNSSMPVGTVYGVSDITLTIGSLPVSTNWAVISFTIPMGSTHIFVRFPSSTAGDWFEVDWYWIGDLDATTKQLYTTGTLSEEAARISNQLGDSAGIGVAASGTITLTSLPTAGDTVTIGGKVFTFRALVADLTAEGDVLIGGSIATTSTNLTWAIRRHTSTTYDKSVGGSDPRYYCANTHPFVTATGASPTVVYYGYSIPSTYSTYVTIPGSIGNQVTLATSAPTRITLSGSTLTGGVDDVAAKIASALANNFFATDAEAIAGTVTNKAIAPSSGKAAYDAKSNVYSGVIIPSSTGITVGQMGKYRSVDNGAFTLPAGGTWEYHVRKYGAPYSQIVGNYSLPGSGNPNLIHIGSGYFIAFRSTSLIPYLLMWTGLSFTLVTTGTAFVGTTLAIAPLIMWNGTQSTLLVRRFDTTARLETWTVNSSGFALVDSTDTGSTDSLSNVTTINSTTCALISVLNTVQMYTYSAGVWSAAGSPYTTGTLGNTIRPLLDTISSTDIVYCGGTEKRLTRLTWNGSSLSLVGSYYTLPASFSATKSNLRLIDSSRFIVFWGGASNAQLFQLEWDSSVLAFNLVGAAITGPAGISARLCGEMYLGYLFMAGTISTSDIIPHLMSKGSGEIISEFHGVASGGSTIAPADTSGTVYVGSVKRIA